MKSAIYIKNKEKRRTEQICKWLLSSLLETQFLGEGVVAAHIIAHQIVEMTLTVRNHTEQTAARMHVLLIFLEVRGQFVDAFRQKADLNLRRTGVLVINGHFLDDFALLSLC